jgi:alanyl-tRNA synthetase
MNDRSYYTDSYTAEFSALVTEIYQDEQGSYVTLDKTYFYPTSGGQPFDTGTINDIPVTNISVREQDGAIVHTLKGLPETKEISAVINWERRFDHMQQHTGQHILSQAFIQLAGAQTVGFHLSEDTVTIDLDQETIEQSLIDEAEDLANEIVWQNRPVVVRWTTREGAETLQLRKIPQNGQEKLRLIDILDFDLTACGGTHVARTGEVGLIKIRKTESRNKKTRIHFSCGRRALVHYRSLNTVVNELTSQLTTGTADLSASVTKLQENEKESRRALKSLQDQLEEREAQELLQTGQKIGENTLIVHLFTGEYNDQLRGIAGHLTREKGIIALLGSVGERTHLLFTRSADASGMMKELLQITIKALGAGSGGGNAGFAQGSAPIDDFQAVQRALEEAADALKQETTGTHSDDRP